MKKHMNKIIKQLLLEKDFITSNDLSDEISLKKRTLRYLLDDIDQFLLQHKLYLLERVPNRGIRFLPQEKVKIRQALVEQEEHVLDFSVPEDRQAYLAFLFVCSLKKINMELLVQIMDVSMRTISNDISLLRRRLRPYGVEVVADKKRGYQIRGNLFLARNLLIHDLKRECMIQYVGDILGVLNSLFELHHEENPMNNELLIQQLKGFLDDILPGSYVDDSRMMILLYLLILIMQQKQDVDYGLSDKDKEYLEDNFSFDFAKILCIKAEEIFKLQIHEDEVYCLTILLNSFPGDSLPDYSQNYPFELEVITQKIMQIVSEMEQYEFQADNDLYYIIVNHLMPLVYRLMFNCQITNPLLDSIQARYKSLDNSVQQALVVLEGYAGNEVSADERSFFTLYFASAMEKLSNKNQHKIRVIIVCNSGNAVSRLLQYKLVNSFHVSVVAVTTQKDLYNRILECKPDLIITVIDIDMEQMQGIPYVKISAFMQDEDYVKLGIFLKRQNYVQQALIDEKKPDLLTLLKPECFLLIHEVSSLDELILKSGNLLQLSGCCDEEYVQEMVSVAHSFGALTHILIAPEVILPHAGISKYVQKVGFSFVRLYNPILVNGKLVSCAFAMCTTDKSIHQKAIQQLGKLLNHPQFLQRLKIVKTYIEFENLVTVCLTKWRKDQ